MLFIVICYVVYGHKPFIVSFANTGSLVQLKVISKTEFLQRQDIFLQESDMNNNANKLC